MSKGAPRAAPRADGWPRQSTDVWLYRQPTEGVNHTTQFFRPAEHLAVLSPGPNPQTPDVDGPHGDAHELLAHAHVKRFETVALRDPTDET